MIKELILKCCCKSGNQMEKKTNEYVFSPCNTTHDSWYLTKGANHCDSMQNAGMSDKLAYKLLCPGSIYKKGWEKKNMLLSSSFFLQLELGFDLDWSLARQRKYNQKRMNRESLRLWHKADRFVEHVVRLDNYVVTSSCYNLWG